MTRFELVSIGTARTRYADPADTPVQSALNRDAVGEIHLEPAFAAALDGLDGFDHLWLLSWLGGEDVGRDQVQLRLVPFLLRAAPRELGLFATRTPRRPNPIGLSLVRLIDIDGPIIRFAGVDLVDGTPIIDIKPYAGPLDAPAGFPDVRSGWFDDVPLPKAATPASLGRADPPR